MCIYEKLILFVFKSGVKTIVSQKTFVSDMTLMVFKVWMEMQHAACITHTLFCYCCCCNKQEESNGEKKD